MGQSPQITQGFLDATQYATASIRTYEAVYGEDFVSPGGQQMAIELIEQMNLKPDDRVLDVGFGLGGSAFVMARRFGLIVDGIDLSKNMLEMANKKRAAYGLEERVNLVHGDCLELDRPGYYDAVYSRDVFLHVKDKARLFAVLKRCLRPNGCLLFTDYCCGERPWQQEFEDYVKDRSYCLHTLPEHADLVAAAGFEQVEYRDLTSRFIEILQSDLDTIAGLDLEEAARIKLEQNWRSKLVHSRAGDHRWGLVTAVNPG